MPRRQEGVPAQPVRAAACRGAEKAVQSLACNLCRNRLGSVLLKERPLGAQPGFGCS